MGPVRVNAPAARLAVIAFVVGVLIGAIGLKLGSAEGAAQPAPTAVAHVVQPGETLWGIARTYGPSGGDPRRFVYRLEKMNDLSGPLLAGQVVRLPAG